MIYLHPLVLGLTLGILWGFFMLFLYLASALWGYGKEWVDLVNSVYLVDQVATPALQVILGTGVAFINGLIGGGLIAWIYNKLYGIVALFTL